MKNERSYDAVVVGAGPGGYVAAIRLGQLGVRTAIVEKADLGGVCLNIGCIPSKALIEASKKVAFLRGDLADTMGIQVGAPTVDFEQTQKWKNSIVHKLTSGVGGLLKGNGVDVIQGTAVLNGPGHVTVNTSDGKTLGIQAKNIILATGSRPIEIPGFAYDEQTILSSTGALNLKKIPKRMVVIGGGYIGLEMGGVYARLGSQVTVVEMGDQILPGLAKDLVQPVAKAFRKLGTELLTNSKAVGYKKTRGVCIVSVETRGVLQEIKADAILVTVGRKPNTERLGLETVGIQVDAMGQIPVSETMETGAKGIFAIGDIVAGPMLAHKASKEGEVAAEVIAGRPSAMDVAAIPAVIFTEPEIATVGLSEVEAQKAGYTIATGKFPFAANGRALTTGKSDGFVRVVADKETDVVLGVEIVGPQASDLIAEASLGVEMAAMVPDFGLTVHAHPTLAEGMMEAAGAIHGEAIHMMNRR